MNLLNFKSRDGSFYDLLEQQARATHEAAAAFYAFTTDFSKLQEHLNHLDEIEHAADKVSHTFVNQVNSQFVTPLDKEDMQALTDRLDNITDAIESAAARIGLYRLQQPRKDLQALVGQLVAITQEVVAMVALLRHGFGKTELPEVIQGIHKLETRSDKKFREAITSLFDDEMLDVRALIKWKEIYERIEKAVNRCEQLAGFIQSLMVKYA